MLMPAQTTETNFNSFFKQKHKVKSHIFQITVNVPGILKKNGHESYLLLKSHRTCTLLSEVLTGCKNEIENGKIA